ncbi:hypothetical protein EJB05_31040, partial [Eragrostis curvula]
MEGLKSRTILMGPAKGTRIINKAVIKGYEDRPQHEDPHSSSKAKQKKRKIDELDPEWSKDELTYFYEAYRQHGKDWKKISLAVGSKSSDMVQSLYSIHRTFLSLPERQATAKGFIALVTGHRNVLDESKSHRGGDQTVRESSKVRKQGEATEQKANEGPHLHHSCHDGTISGFSSSFKKRLYGKLVKKRRTHTVGRRTPRIAVTIPPERNANDAILKFENIKIDTNKNDVEINSVCTNIPMDEFSPNGSSGITEAKADQGQTLLDSKGTGDAEICQSKKHLKKRKNQHEDQAGKDEQDYHEMLSDFISEDDMLVLDVLQSLVNAPSKTSKLKINIPSGSLGKTYSALSHGGEVGQSPIDHSKQAKPVDKCSAPKTRQKRHKKILDAEMSAKEQNISVDTSVIPEAQRVNITEVSSLCSDSGKAAMPETYTNISVEVDPSAPAETKTEIKISRRTKRKSEMHQKTAHVPCNGGSDNFQARKLQHCLSSQLLRRWCTYEWFYSAVDYPWFSDNEFVSYLNHANLCHLSRLTRSEWSTIRSSLGKPRRFSDHFLAAEKEKLEDYREKVRKIYAQLSDGSRDSLPADLAKPFSIGQQVIVRHPSSRELSDGKVVMMGRDFYKVHFNNPDLGIDIVKDTDCMPVNWLDNRPDMRSYLSNKAHSVLEMKHIPSHTPSKEFYHLTNGVSVPEQPKRLHLIPDEHLKVEIAVNSERPPTRCTSNGAVLSEVYKEIEGYLAIIANQILALVPTTLGNGPAVSPIFEHAANETDHKRAITGTQENRKSPEISSRVKKAATEGSGAKNCGWPDFSPLCAAAVASPRLRYRAAARFRQVRASRSVAAVTPSSPPREHYSCLAPSSLSRRLQSGTFLCFSGRYGSRGTAASFLLNTDASTSVLRKGAGPGAMDGGKKKCSENGKGSKVAPPGAIRKEGKKTKQQEATSFRVPLSTPNDVGILCSAHQDGSSQRFRGRAATHNVSYQVDCSDSAATPDSRRAPVRSPSQGCPYTGLQPPRPPEHSNEARKKRKHDEPKEESVRAHVRVKGVGVCSTQGTPIVGHDEPQCAPVDYSSWPDDSIRELRQLPEHEWFPCTREPHVRDHRFWTVKQEDLYHSLRSFALHVHKVLPWDELKTASEGRDIKGHFSHIDGLDMLVSRSGLKLSHDIIYVFFATLWIAPNRSYIRFMYGDKPRHLTKQQLADALGICIVGPSIHNLAYPDARSDSCRQKLKATKLVDQKIRFLLKGSLPEGFRRDPKGLTREASVTLNATRYSVLPRAGYRNGFTPVMQWLLYHLMSHQPFDFIDLMISEMEDAIYNTTKRRMPYGPYILRALHNLEWMPDCVYTKLEEDVALYRVPKLGDKRLGTRTSAGNNEIQIGDGDVYQHKENDSSTSTQPQPQPTHEATQLPALVDPSVIKIILEVLGGLQQNHTLSEKAVAIIASDLHIVASDVQMILDRLGISSRSRLQYQPIETAVRCMISGRQAIRSPFGVMEGAERESCGA